MSIPRNNLIRELGSQSLFASALPVLSRTVTYNQGDLLAFDTVGHVLMTITGSGNTANLVGVALQTIVNGVMPSPYQGTPVDASQALEDFGGPRYGNIFQMYLNPGDSFYPGQKIYATGDPQTITSAVTGSSIGLFQGQQAVTSAVSGQLGDCLIGARYGFTDIQF